MDWNRMLYSLIVALIFCGIFVFSMQKDRSRYRNIVLLLFAVGSVLSLIFSFWGEASETVILVMMVVVFLFLLLLPFFLIANGFVMIRREGKSLANLLSLLFGIFLFAGEMAAFFWGFGLFLGPEMGFQEMTELVSKMSPVLVLLMITALYLSLTFLAFVFCCVFLQLIPIRRDFDYVIIHGAGLRKEKLCTDLIGCRFFWNRIPVFFSAHIQDDADDR